MARQEKATAIVMMCNFVEQNPADGQAFVASSEYFPLKKNEICEFEGGSVKCTNYEREYIGIITRKLTLNFDDGEEFKITHHQVLDWNGLNALEDHRGAGLAAMFLMKYETTAIVHCVDGVSRSAVLAGMIIGFQKIIETRGDMNVADLIDDLRKQRAMAITSGLELAFVDAGIFLLFKRMMNNFEEEYPEDLKQMLKDAVQYYKLIAGYQVQQRDNYFKKLDNMGKKQMNQKKSTEEGVDKSKEQGKDATVMKEKSPLAKVN